MAAIDIVNRKNLHLHSALQPQAQMTVPTGLGAIRFEPDALPELALDKIDTTTRFLGRTLNMPVMISSMTGGPARAGTLNRLLARAAEDNRIALALGSMRVALEDPATLASFQVRAIAPHIPILANIGGAQLCQKQGVDNALRCIELAEANAIIIHLNPLQEALQRSGDTDWRGVQEALSLLVKRSPAPVVVKEVGHGISRKTADKLIDAGIRYIDVAGAGGTSWAAIETLVESGEQPDALGTPFRNFGITLVEALEVLAPCRMLQVIASGGIRSGLDVAKVIRLGAIMAGAAQPFLQAAEQSPEHLHHLLQQWQKQLAITLFAVGANNLEALMHCRLLGTGCQNGG